MYYYILQYTLAFSCIQVDVYPLPSRKHYFLLLANAISAY